MSDAIYDRRGSVVGWLKGDWILDHASARWAGFLNRDTNVISVRGGFLGRFQNGLFRDNNGAVVAFVDGAQGGPIKPIKQLKPIRPITPIKPIKPIAPIAPISPIKSSNWGLPWSAFIRG